MRCPTDGMPIKPNIVFFGEQLPSGFFQAINEIGASVDLCLIMGTALAVSPFNMLPGMVASGVPKVLFNMDNTH